VEAINAQAPKDGNSPSLEMKLIIEELMNPIYFENAREERVNHGDALTRINNILRPYKLEVVPDSETEKPELLFVDGSFVSSATSAIEAIRKITFCPGVFQVPKEQDVQQDLVALMMPFLAEFNPVHSAIRSACKSVKLRCKRADDIWASSPIIQDVFDLIFVSRIVVVDFTGKNANVLYETGIAHTLGKHVVPITQSLDDVPFDVRGHRVLKYHPNQQGLTTLTAKLAARLTTIIEGHSWAD
jgi:hypothetical protein